MKLAIMPLLATGTLLAADTPVITSVAPDAERNTLIVRYDLSGRGHQQRVVLPTQVADYRYCNWMPNGIAVVARTASSKSSEFYFAAFRLTETSGATKAVKISVPAGDYPVLGIGNTIADSVVITAVEHQRAPSARLRGWMYIDNCPLTDAGVSAGYIVQLDVSASRPANESKQSAAPEP